MGFIDNTRNDYGTHNIFEILYKKKVSRRQTSGRCGTSKIILYFKGALDVYTYVSVNYKDNSIFNNWSPYVKTATELVLGGYSKK